MVMIEENLLEEILDVVQLSNRRVNTVEGEEEETETEFEELNDADNDNDNNSTTCNNSKSDDDALLETANSFQSMELNNKSTKNEKDESLKSISALPERSLKTQDSTQRLASVDYNIQERPQPRSRRRRRRSIKDSIASLFSSSSHSKRESDCCVGRKQKRTPSPRDPQRTSTPRSQRFSLSSISLKKRSVSRRKKHGQRRFSALSLEFDLFHSSDKMDRRSMPIRQSSSTAFTSAAFEVSQVFDREALAADLDEEESEELSSPFGRQVVF